MTDWQYKVQVFGVPDNPYFKGSFTEGSMAKGLEDALDALGKEGWELMHVKDVKGDWVSDPERYPGGDPGRMSWSSGRTVMYFKRPKKEEKKPIPVPKIGRGE